MPQRPFHPTRRQEDEPLDPASGLALLRQRIEQLEDNEEELTRKVQALEEQRTNALVWGVIALGSALVGLVVWIVNHIKNVV